MNRLNLFILILLLLLPDATRCVSAQAAVGPPVALKLVGDWSVEVIVGEQRTNVVKVAAPRWVVVDSEKQDQLPVFNARAGGWLKGVQLKGVRAQETTTPFLLDPASVVVRGGMQADAKTWEKGKDYEVDLIWGTLGRLTNGAIKANQPVFVSYRHGQLRLDSIVQRPDGRIEVREGESKAAAPRPAALGSGEVRWANIWIPGVLTNLQDKHLFPLLEPAFPEVTRNGKAPAETLLPKTLARLRSGEHLRVLAWGDSVTDGSYLPRPDRWQEQFVARLQLRFPTARIELVTEAWGGRNTHSYTNEPPGSPHNYREKVLAAKPDLVISEFVNDAGLNPRQVEQRYSLFRSDFAALGAEWIILTPHYVRPDWMGLDREREIDEDPRPYVAGLRQFARKHNVALADAAARYGRLWRQGLPYTSLMLNSINHPDDRGMRIFADALLEIFP